jgi:hypothetical protein
MLRMTIPFYKKHPEAITPEQIDLSNHDLVKALAYIPFDELSTDTKMHLQRTYGKPVNLGHSISFIQPHEKPRFGCSENEISLVETVTDMYEGERTLRVLNNSYFAGVSLNQINLFFPGIGVHEKGTILPSFYFSRQPELVRLMKGSDPDSYIDFSNEKLVLGSLKTVVPWNLNIWFGHILGEFVDLPKPEGYEEQMRLLISLTRNWIGNEQLLNDPYLPNVSL